MSIKQIVKYLELKSQLSPEDLAFAERIVGWTESDKELLAGLLRPTKPAKPVTRRVIEKCGAKLPDESTCGMTRRALIHSATASSVLAHDFLPSPQSSSAKSKRAESLGKAIGKKVADKETPLRRLTSDKHREPEVGGFADDVDMLQCRATVDDNGGEMECGKKFDDNIHHKRTDPDYHEFQFATSEQSAAVGG